MRFLLVVITLIFSFIFYLFYTASLGKNIFFQSSNNFFFGKSIFGEMWITPIIFLIITIGLFFYFKSTLSEKVEKYRPVQNNSFFKYILFTTVLYIFIFIIFFILNIDFYWIIFAYTSGIGIYFISKYLFYHRKISKNLYISCNIFSIISGYLASILGLLYIQYIQEDLLFLSILVFIGFFHVYIHVKYENIISLLFGIITFIFSLYRLIVHLFPGII